MRHSIYSGAALALALALVGCGSVDPTLVQRPDGVPAFTGDRADLIATGETLWNDNSLGTAGISCASCHVNGAQFKDSFKEPYPHRVAMAKSMSDLESIDAEQMTQFCMLVPMKGQPLPWDSKELAALAAYIENVEQPRFAAR
jgi:cytochrome c